MNIDNPVSLEPGEQIIKLAEMAEEKFLQSRDKPVILAMVDDLSFLPKSDSTVQLNFSWLCENGPLVQVWLIAALETQAALSMGRWIRYFKTRILGKMEQASADRLGLASSSMSESLIAGIQFAVLINNTWYHFHLPGRHPRGRNRT